MDVSDIAEIKETSVENNTEVIEMGSVLSRDQGAGSANEENDVSINEAASSIEPTTVITSSTDDSNKPNSVNVSESNKSTKRKGDVLVETYTKDLSAQDINLIIMGQPSSSSSSSDKSEDNADSDSDLFQQDVLAENDAKPCGEVQDDFEDIVHDLEEILDENSESCKLSRGFSMTSTDANIDRAMDLDVTEAKSIDLLTSVVKESVCDDVRKVEKQTGSPQKIKLIRPKTTVEEVSEPVRDTLIREEILEVPVIVEKRPVDVPQKSEEVQQKPIDAEEKPVTTRKIKLNRNFSQINIPPAACTEPTLDRKENEDELRAIRAVTKAEEVVIVPEVIAAPTKEIAMFKNEPKDAKESKDVDSTEKTFVSTECPDDSVEATLSRKLVDAEILKESNNVEGTATKENVPELNAKATPVVSESAEHIQVPECVQTVDTTVVETSEKVEVKQMIPEENKSKSVEQTETNIIPIETVAEESTVKECEDVEDPVVVNEEIFVQHSRSVPKEESSFIVQDTKVDEETGNEEHLEPTIEHPKSSATDANNEDDDLSKQTVEAVSAIATSEELDEHVGDVCLISDDVVEKNLPSTSAEVLEKQSLAQEIESTVQSSITKDMPEHLPLEQKVEAVESIPRLEEVRMEVVEPEEVIPTCTSESITPRYSKTVDEVTSSQCNFFESSNERKTAKNDDPNKNQMESDLEVSSSSVDEKVKERIEPLQEVQVSSATTARTKASTRSIAGNSGRMVSGVSVEVSSNIHVETKKKSCLAASSAASDVSLPERHDERITKPLTILVDDDTVSSTKVLTPKRSHESKERRQGHYSPKITIKPIIKPPDENKESIPKVTIKTVTTSEYSSQLSSNDDNVNPLKITIKKQKTEESHSILKIYNPEDSNAIPKFTIKPVDSPHSPKMFKTHKMSSVSPGQSSPRISPLKLTIKPILKPDDNVKQMSPKTSKKSSKNDGDLTVTETMHHSPRITIKPLVKPPDEREREQSPIKFTLKRETSPKVTIKPIIRPAEENYPESHRDVQLVDVDDIVKPERIVLKIQKNTFQEVKRSETSEDPEKNEKLKKIKLKLLKEDGHAQIINFKGKESNSLKRLLSDGASESSAKQMKLDMSVEQLSTPELSISLVQNEPKLPLAINEGVTITRIEPKESEMQSKLKEMLLHIATKPHEDSSSSDDVKIISVTPAGIPSGINDTSDDLMIIDTKITPINQSLEIVPIPLQSITPKKRGRPRKVPLEVREDFKEITPSPAPEASTAEKNDEEESSRPKRSCRGPSARTALGLKERKPRASRGARGAGVKRATTKRAPAKPRISKLTAAKIKAAKALAKKEARALMEAPFKELPGGLEPPKIGLTPVVGYEEETRMSAENSSRAQTPARQIHSNVPSEGPEESQSSVLSTATTESGKVRRAIGTRLEVVEPEGTIISADQLAEYSWSNSGPYMLQEQVAQYLGVKSFKRKYPGIQRRPVDMQERDFIRESGLASEAMCDLGLTAVPSADVLDIMYTDFQPKYEEYCKHQRDRQAKDFINKQKALSLATSQEKNKLDITEQALQSAASWNSNFNRARKDTRRACMDLQTMTIHFPKGKAQQISKPPVGHYPIALVPGQFTDYYRTFTTTELKHMPFNSVQLGPLQPGETIEEDDVSDGSQSDSDSSSSDSDSSDSDSSIDEDCKMCISAPSTPIAKKVIV